MAILFGAGRSPTNSGSVGVARSEHRAVGVPTGTDARRSRALEDREPSGCGAGLGVA